jgi:hypothetical protein
MSLPEIDLDEIVKNNKVFRFTSELQHTSDSNRQKELKSIIKLLDGIKTTEDDAQSLLNEMCTDLTTQSMKKKWGKLCPIQKITKIKEYLSENISNKSARDKIQNLAIDLINKGKLKTAKDVVYDDKNYKIVHINCLKKEIDKFKDNVSSDSSFEESD